MDCKYEEGRIYEGYTSRTQHSPAANRETFGERLHSPIRPHPPSPLPGGVFGLLRLEPGNIASNTGEQVSLKTLVSQLFLFPQLFFLCPNRPAAQFVEHLGPVVRNSPVDIARVFDALLANVPDVVDDKPQQNADNNNNHCKKDARGNLGAIRHRLFARARNIVVLTVETVASHDVDLPINLLGLRARTVGDVRREGEHDSLIVVKPVPLAHQVLPRVISAHCRKVGDRELGFRIEQPEINRVLAGDIRDPPFLRRLCRVLGEPKGLVRRLIERMVLAQMVLRRIILVSAVDHVAVIVSWVAVGLRPMLVPFF